MANESKDGYFKSTLSALVFFLCAALLYYSLTVPFGFCIVFVIFGVVSVFLVNFGLPLAGIIFLVRWGERYRRTRKLPWQPDDSKPLLPLTPEQEAARAGERAKLEAATQERKREEAKAAFREQRRMDRLAMTYYIEDALREGRGKTAVLAALRQKGWPEEDIVAAFRACGTEFN